MCPQTFTANTWVLSRNFQLAQTGLQVLTLQAVEDPGYRPAVKAENFIARENVVSIQLKS